MIEYQTPLFRKKVKVTKSIVWVCVAILSLAACFIILAYFGVQLGVEDKLYSNFESFLTKNKYAVYINPIYIRLIQILLHWVSFACLISVLVGGILLYLISPKPSYLIFGICFFTLAIMNLFHFLTVEHVLFTKYPFAWSIFTWWEARMGIPITLTFGTIIAICGSNLKTYTNKGITLFTLLFFALYMFVFVYFSMGMETTPQFFFTDNIDHLLLVSIPLAITLVILLPLLLVYYKRNKTYFGLLIIISLIPQILAEAYTILDPQVHYYNLLNFAYLLQLLGFFLPCVGLLLDAE